MSDDYRVLHDPHPIPLMGVRFTRRQIIEALKCGDLLPGMLFAHLGQRVLLTPVGLVKTGKGPRSEDRL